MHMFNDSLKLEQTLVVALVSFPSLELAAVGSYALYQNGIYRH